MYGTDGGALDKRLRHEAELHEGPHAAGEIGVEDPVDDAPVIDGVARGILGVGVGAAPLERRRAVAGGQQVVRAEIDVVHGFSAPSSAEQLAAILHGRVVRLVGAEEAPDGRERRACTARIHLDGDVEAVGRGTNGAGQDQCGQG